MLDWWQHFRCSEISTFSHKSTPYRDIPFYAAQPREPGNFPSGKYLYNLIDGLVCPWARCLGDRAPKLKRIQEKESVMKSQY
eukprot:1393990-Amorphochlora_amoeboformis.AAC.1